MLTCAAGHPAHQLAGPAVWRCLQGGLHAGGGGDCGGARAAAQGREDAVPRGQQAVALAPMSSVAVEACYFGVCVCAESGGWTVQAEEMQLLEANKQ